MEHQLTTAMRPHAGRRSNQEINEIISEYEVSGFSVEEYCEYKGLNPDTLQSWLHRHRNKESNPLSFAPVMIKDEPVDQELFAEYRGFKFYQPLSAEFIKIVIG